MISHYRRQFNRQFTEARYEAMLDWIAAQFGHRPPFKIAETPVFVPRDLKQQILEACDEIVDILIRPDFLKRSQSAVLAGQEVPNETPNTHFLQLDFGICRARDGALFPQLIEVQGFPSLYLYQDFLGRAYRQNFDIPEEMHHLFGGLDSDSYRELMRRVVVGDTDPEQVVLLEVQPRAQPTQIDFIVTEQLLGVSSVCVSDLKVSGREVYYRKNGRSVRVEKIYNRVIFDELIKQDNLAREFYFTHEYDVQWVGHPNWFFRISKHTLPLLSSQYVPDSYFLHELEDYPDDLHNYVLKPLYSFSGTGVIINLNRYDLEGIDRPENYILQRKVHYAPVVETLEEPAKCEIRMLMIWEPGADRPRIVNNLVRLSKGEMIGVRHNKGKTWVGGSIGFFAP